MAGAAGVAAVMQVAESESVNRPAAWDALNATSAIAEHPPRDSVLTARARALLLRLCGPNIAPHAEQILVSRKRGREPSSLGAALVELRAAGHAREADALESLVAAAPAAPLRVLLSCRRSRHRAGHADEIDNRPSVFSSLAVLGDVCAEGQEGVAREQHYRMRGADLLVPHARLMSAYRPESVPRGIFTALVERETWSVENFTTFHPEDFVMDGAAVDFAIKADQGSTITIPDWISAGARRRMEPESSERQRLGSSDEALQRTRFPAFPAAASKLPQAEHRRHRRGHRKNPWLRAAAMNPRAVPTEFHSSGWLTSREELVCSVQPELQLAFRRALEKIDLHPQRRICLQALSVLLGAPSALLPDVASALIGPLHVLNVDLPPLAARLCQREESVAVLSRMRASLKERARSLLYHAQLENSVTSQQEGVREEDFLDLPPQQDAVLRRSAFCGRVYRSLALFADTYSTGELGAVLQAAALFIGSVLDQYAGNLMRRLDQDPWSCGPKGHCPVTPWTLLIDAEQFEGDLEAIGFVVKDIERTDGSACEVLDVLYRAACRHNGDQVLYKMFLAAAIPYLHMLWDWSFSASTTRDSQCEFFGKVLELDAGGPELSSPEGEPHKAPQNLRYVRYPCFLSHSSAQKILRAGRARALLTAVDPEHKLLGIKAPDLDAVFRGLVSVKSLRRLQDVLHEYSSEILNVTSPSESQCERSYEMPAAGCLSRAAAVSALNVATRSEVGAAHIKPAPLRAPDPRCPDSGKEQEDEDCRRELTSMSNVLYGARRPARNPVQGSLCGVFGFPNEIEHTKEKRSASLFLTTATSRALEPGKSLEEASAVDAAPVQFMYEAGWPPLCLLMEIMVTQPIEIVDSAVQREVLDHYLRELQVQSHLDTLWKYAMLGSGEFADAMVVCLDASTTSAESHEVDILRQQVLNENGSTMSSEGGPGGVLLRQRARLAQCLQNALSISGADGDPLTSRLSIDVEFNNESSGVVAESVSFPESESWCSADGSVSQLWDQKMRLDYRAEFPLSFIISRGILDRCAVFFNFFLQVRRAEHALRRLFMTFRRQSSLRAHSRHPEALLGDGHLCTRVWRFSWEAEHFVRIVGGYEATQVLGYSWSSLRAVHDSHGASASASSARGGNVWTLRDAVHGCLAESAQRALLDDKHRSIMRVIAGALREIVRVDALLLGRGAADGGGDGDGDDDDGAGRWRRRRRRRLRCTSAEERASLLVAVNKASESIQRRSRFLVGILGKLVSSGASERQPHLVDVLNQLNYNGFYQNGA